jgi:predicted esterase
MNIHQRQPVINYGAEVDDVNLFVILLHGRGSTAESMLPVAEALSIDGLRFIIPQAGFNRWYPNSAFAPLEANEPDLSAALDRIHTFVENLEKDGFSKRQIVFGGFSQGACLAAEYTARNTSKYAGLFAFSGALIGPKDKDFNYSGYFSEMPVFISKSEFDPWIPSIHVKDTVRIFKELGATVHHHTYPGMSHTINQDEIQRVRSFLSNYQKNHVTPFL